MEMRYRQCFALGRIEERSTRYIHRRFVEAFGSRLRRQIAGAILTSRQTSNSGSKFQTPFNVTAVFGIVSSRMFSCSSEGFRVFAGVVGAAHNRRTSDLVDAPR